MNDKPRNDSNGEMFKLALDWAKDFTEKSLLGLDQTNVRVTKLEAETESIKTRLNNLENLKATFFSTVKVVLTIGTMIGGFIFGMMKLISWIFDVMTKLNG